MFKKGKSGNPVGKQKGSQHKTTKQAKELVLLAIDNQAQKFDSVMDLLEVQDPKEWARIMVKMFDFVLPRQVDIKSDGQPLMAPVIQILPE